MQSMSLYDGTFFRFSLTFYRIACSFVYFQQQWKVRQKKSARFRFMQRAHLRASTNFYCYRIIIHIFDMQPTSSGTLEATKRRTNERIRGWRYITNVLFFSQTVIIMITTIIYEISTDIVRINSEPSWLSAMTSKICAHTHRATNSAIPSWTLYLQWQRVWTGIYVLAMRFTGTFWHFLLSDLKATDMCSWFAF